MDLTAARDSLWVDFPSFSLLALWCWSFLMLVQFGIILFASEILQQLAFCLGNNLCKSGHNRLECDLLEKPCLANSHYWYGPARAHMQWSFVFCIWWFSTNHKPIHSALWEVGLANCVICLSAGSQYPGCLVWCSSGTDFGVRMEESAPCEEIELTLSCGHHNFPMMPSRLC